jgi:hypothetical protein
MVRPHSPYDAYHLLHFGRRAGDTLDHHRLGVGRVACYIRRWALTSLIFSGNFAGPNTSSLIEVDKALESMRDAGFDFEAASGDPSQLRRGHGYDDPGPTEVLEARQVDQRGRVRRQRAGHRSGCLTTGAQDGLLHPVNQRKGLGRSGVGLKLAGLSLVRRIEVTTKPAGSDRFYRVFIDFN